MSVRVGHIMRHEDVHGVSGTGKVADVFEASNGKCILIWDSAHSSVNVYDHIKDLERTHSHGGKTLVVWDWESPPDPDPMDKLHDVDKPGITDEEIEEIAAEAAGKVATLIATKVKEADLNKDDPSEKKEKVVKRAKKKPLPAATAKKKDPAK